jgi:hypothetical protein
MIFDFRFLICDWIRTENLLFPPYPIKNRKSKIEN